MKPVSKEAVKYSQLKKKKKLSQSFHVGHQYGVYKEIYSKPTSLAKGQTGVKGSL